MPRPVANSAQPQRPAATPSGRPARQGEPGQRVACQAVIALTCRRSSPSALRMAKSWRRRRPDTMTSWPRTAKPRTARRMASISGAPHRCSVLGDAVRALVGHQAWLTADRGREPAIDRWKAATAARRKPGRKRSSTNWKPGPPRRSPPSCGAEDRGCGLCALAEVGGVSRPGQVREHRLPHDAIHAAAARPRSP